MCHEFLLYLIGCLLMGVRYASSHGMLMDPPARNVMWRFGFYSPTNFNDNQLYCGGFTRQWTQNGGKCGLCGDPFDSEREHEAGGKYANGIIARTYRQGETINVRVILSVNHQGYFLFNLCPVNNYKTKVTQSCLDSYPLIQPDGDPHYRITGTSPMNISIALVLPKYLTCSQCVLRWFYNTVQGTHRKRCLLSNRTTLHFEKVVLDKGDCVGQLHGNKCVRAWKNTNSSSTDSHRRDCNSWGCPEKRESDAECCLGCGKQEQYYNCADIEIVGNKDGGQGMPATQRPAWTTRRPTTTWPVWTPRPTASTPAWTPMPPVTRPVWTQKPTTRRPWTRRPTTAIPDWLNEADNYYGKCRARTSSPDSGYHMWCLRWCFKGLCPKNICDDNCRKAFKDKFVV